MITGSDAVTYHESAVAIAEQGILSSDIPSLPYRPAGYPAFIGIFYEIFGVEPRWVMVAQVGLLAVGTIFVYLFLVREFGPKVGLVSVALLSFNPALFAAPAFLMYETALGSLLCVAVDLLSRARHAFRASRRVGFALGAGGMLALASIIQPKVLVTGVLATAWLLWRLRSWLPAALCIVSLSIGPTLLLARTYATEGRLALATHAGDTMAAGFGAESVGILRPGTPLPEGCDPPADEFGRDRELIRCSLEWAVRHPLQTAQLSVIKVLYFFTPMVGPFQDSWIGIIDWRKLLPDGVTDAAWFDNADLAARAAWAVLYFGVLLVGAWVGLRKHRQGTLLLLIPTISFLLVTIVSLSDFRFRLPVAPFYTPLLGLVLIHLVKRGRHGSNA